MDNQEVCKQLNISPRTLQTLRDNGTLTYSQINHKVFYSLEDVMNIVKPVERKRADREVSERFKVNRRTLQDYRNITAKQSGVSEHNNDNCPIMPYILR